MIYNNINIKYDDFQFTYAFGYDDMAESGVQLSNRFKIHSEDLGGSEFQVASIYGNRELYLLGKTDYVKRRGEWQKLSHLNSLNTSMPLTYNPANIRIFFPYDSIDTYKNNVYYLVNVFIRIGNDKISLASRIINRQQTLAVDSIKEMYGHIYAEYCDIDIIDPLELLYNEKWENFRNSILSSQSDYGRPMTHDKCEIPVSVVIIPVEKKMDGTYINLPGSTGGQNSIALLSKNQSLSVSLSTNAYDNDGKSIEVYANTIFNKNFKNLSEYINNIYAFDDKFYNGSAKIEVEYELIMGDQTDIYKKINKRASTINALSSCIFSREELLFDNWVGYKEGISIICSANIYINDYSLIYVLSNPIPLTPDLFARLVKTEFDYINLNNINMNIYNINTVNKHVTQVVNMSTPEDSKSNIIQPVFFRVAPLDNIVIHPAITENICINLDAYKSKVEYFMLLIDGISFQEIGRNHNGVIFKVVGSKLPQKNLIGTFYVTNENSDVITSGEYKYKN